MSTFQFPPTRVRQGAPDATLQLRGGGCQGVSVAGHCGRLRDRRILLKPEDYAKLRDIQDRFLKVARFPPPETKEKGRVRLPPPKAPGPHSYGEKQIDYSTSITSPTITPR